MTVARTTLSLQPTQQPHRVRRFMATAVAVAAVTATGTLGWRVAAHDGPSDRYFGPAAPFIGGVEIPPYQGPVAPFTGAPNLAELGIILDPPK